MLRTPEQALSGLDEQAGPELSTEAAPFKGGVSPGALCEPGSVSRPLLTKAPQPTLCVGPRPRASVLSRPGSLRFSGSGPYGV